MKNTNITCWACGSSMEQRLMNATLITGVDVNIIKDVDTYLCTNQKCLEKCYTSKTTELLQKLNK